MMKSHHLKMYIDRLMKVPRAPKAGGSEVPIDHAGAKLPNPETPMESRSLFDEGEDKDDGFGPASILDRDTTKEPMSLESERNDDEGERMPNVKPASPEKAEGFKAGSLKSMLSQHNPSKGEYASKGPMMEKGAKPSSPEPQSVMKPHVTIAMDLSPMDHEKKVKEERARWAKMMGD